MPLPDRIATVQQYQAASSKKIEVIFNVFKDTDYAIYRHSEPCHQFCRHIGTLAACIWNWE